MTLEELEIVVKANVEEATTKLEGLKAQMQTATQDGFKQITKESENMGEAVDQVGNNLDKFTPQIAQMATKAITGSSAMAGLGKTAIATGTAIKSAFPILLAVSLIITAIVKAVQALKEKIDNTIKAIKQGLKTALETIIKLLQKIRQVAGSLITILGNLAKNGINNLVQSSQELNNALSEIQGKTTQLSNALASAVAPIIQALTPIILEMLNALISVANILGEITASLFGNAKTFKKATTVTTNYAKSVAGANKEQQKMLAGFDELNVLADKQSSGGIMTPVSEMFEPTEIRKEIQDLTKKVKEVFAEAKLKIDMGDFEGAGDTIGKAFNEMIDKLPTEQWGRNIADKMNKALELVNGFLKNNPLGKIGKKLGEFVRGWVNEISPVEIGRAIANVINNAFSFVGNFFGTLNENRSLLELGKKLASNLKELINSLNTDEIANAIFQTVYGLADLAIGFFGDWIFNGGLIDLIKKIQELFSKIPWEELLPQVIKAIAAAWLAINGTKLALKLLIMYEIVSWIGGALKDAIVNAVQGIWNKIFNTADENGKTLMDKLKEKWADIKKWWDGLWKNDGSKFDAVRNYFKSCLRSIAEVVVEGFNKIIRKINSFHFEMPDWLGGQSFSPNLKEMKVPEFANGGVVSRPTALIAGEYAGASQNPEIIAPQKLLYETSTQANIPVMNAVEELGDKLVNAFNSIGVYAEFDYSKLKVGLDNENYRVGGKLYGV